MSKKNVICDMLTLISETMLLPWARKKNNNNVAKVDNNRLEKKRGITAKQVTWPHEKHSIHIS